ncbi:MAG TPA: beta-galactosidase [Ruminiclostridium sp.]|nr:beta-galactosidase [Ruminiclostridium sp.]
MKFAPINPKFPKMLHGGDYNPEQWMDIGIWDEDMRLMDLAHCNTMTIGIFSWSALEPEEGKFDFTWMDKIMDRLKEHNGYAVLATPSGARPAWLSQKYPEVLRVNEDRTKNLHGQRHNHCYTSPVYREKTQIINRKLAERYQNHPALLVWHISNEFGGECHCELCQEAFRNWLKVRYEGDLNKLNHAWWNSFWSHTYTDWSQVVGPSSLGELAVHAQKLDWKRFVTYQTIDFYKSEIVPIREITPSVPITTNLMGTYGGLDYWKFAKELDVVSWDNYPSWHNPDGDSTLASDISFVHDINRSLKGGKPFMLMESTPSMTNWQPISKLKRPGMHLLSSLQAVAHGSDTVQYFQWRKSRGSSEKFHGAVVDHCGHENTRVFRDVTDVGQALGKLDAVVGTSVQPDVALIFDWENRWAIDDAQGLNNSYKDYEKTCKKHYQAFWEEGVPVDVIDMDCDFSKYKLLVAPMLYMIKPGVGERIEQFVKAGGTFVTTYASGMVNESDLCFLGGFPGPLRKVLGIWDEETDSLYSEDHNFVNMNNKSYRINHICALIHCDTAQVLATYGNDFYAGRPALTVNTYGDGKSYYIAFRNNEDFEKDFYCGLISELGLLRALDAQLPTGVTAVLRTDGEKDFIFLMNFLDEANQVFLEENIHYIELLTGSKVNGKVDLEGFGIMVLERAHK